MTNDLMRRMQPNCILGYQRGDIESYDKILRIVGDEVLVFRPQGKYPYTALSLKDTRFITVLPPIRIRR
jgi:hypothetical protein